MNHQFKDRVAEAYGSHSEKYTSVLEPLLRPMADEMARLAGSKSVQLALDLATGTGLIARAVAPFAESVAGIDISPGMLGRARGQTGGKIAFVSGDAHRLPFKDACFDLVTCGVSLTHFSDVSVALGEVRRLLRPGGRFITSAWGSGVYSPAKAAAVGVRKKFLAEKGITFGGSFGDELWADGEQGSKALRAAGFEDVQVNTSALTGEYRDHSEAIEIALAWPVTRYRIAQLALHEQRRLREETELAIGRVDDLRWRSEVHYYQAARPEDT
jgi:SAM-dependent methyltransferase